MRVRSSIFLISAALVVMPACQRDDPVTELPCEFYEQAPEGVEIPEECRDQIPPTTTTAPAPDETDDPPE